MDTLAGLWLRAKAAVVNILFTLGLYNKQATIVLLGARESAAAAGGGRPGRRSSASVIHHGGVGGRT